MKTALICWLLLLGACAVSCSGPRYDRWQHTAHYDFEMRVDLTELQEADTDDVRLWLPKPVENEVQQVLSYEVVTPWLTRETTDPAGNQFVYLERPSRAGKTGAEPAGAELLVRFRIRRMPEGVASSEAGRRPEDLGSDAQIPLSGAIATTSEQVMQGQSTDAQRIRAAYDFVVGSMRYDKSTPGWGQGNALRALDVKAGNCTDFHSLFMGLTRSHDIAARFTMGYPIPADRESGSIGGYHCWSAAYDPQAGWTPVDASEASKAGTPDAFYGHLPSDRVAFTTGRDLILEPPQSGPALNFFIYPYAEIDGEAVTPPWTLNFTRLAFEETVRP